MCVIRDNWIDTPPEQRSLLLLANAQHEVVVDVRCDGLTRFGPGYKDKTEAAKLFWECVGSEHGAMHKVLGELVEFIENHKALKNADPCAALVEAKKLLGRKAQGDAS